jgi:hypothetical protein
VQIKLLSGSCNPIVPIQRGVVHYFGPLFLGRKTITSQEDVVQLRGIKWEHLLEIGLTDGRKVDAGPEYARGLRVIDEMRDVGKQVPGLKQVVQMHGRLYEININPMDVMQDLPGKQEACICERLWGLTLEKVQFCRGTLQTHDVIFLPTLHL